MDSPAPQTLQFMVATLNARLQPMHRREFFADPLDEVIKPLARCEVSGGGTMTSREGEVAYCDIEISGPEMGPGDADLIVATLEKLGAPKGSKLTIESTREEIPFGRTEGLAVYLNGTDLPDETYRDCDSNHVYDEFDRLLQDEGRVLSWWQSPTETAFYMYGRSFEEMKRRLADFIASYPLCARCRLEQVA